MNSMMVCLYVFNCFEGFPLGEFLLVALGVGAIVAGVQVLRSRR